MRRFTPFIVIGILLLCFFIIGLIFDKPSGSFSIWNQLTPPARGKHATWRPDPPKSGGGGGVKPSLATWRPDPPKSGGGGDIIL
jgi:hypothetical protein